MSTYTEDDQLTVSYEAPLEPAPEGRHTILCVDVVPVEPEEATYDGVTKLYEKVVVVFQVFPEDGSKDSNGKPFQVERKFTRSLAPQAQLRMALEKWRGRDFTSEELKSVSLAKLKGVAAWGTIVHSTRFVNIQDIEPYLDEEGKPLTAPKAEAYARRTYKKKAKASATAQSTTQSQTSSGSDKNDSIDKSAWVPF
jgi:hypothetical protein